MLQSVQYHCQSVENCTHTAMQLYYWFDSNSVLRIEHKQGFTLNGHFLQFNQLKTSQEDRGKFWRRAQQSRMKMLSTLSSFLNSHAWRASPINSNFFPQLPQVCDKQIKICIKHTFYFKYTQNTPACTCTPIQWCIKGPDFMLWGLIICP